VAGPLLIDCGRSSEYVGVFFAFPVVAATAIGALAGGGLADWLGHARAVACLTAVIALDVSALAAAYAASLGVSTIVGLLTALDLLYGAFAASSYAMFMDLTDPSLGATQFSAFMGATNLCEVWATYAVGRLVVTLDYAGAFLILAVVSFVSIPLVLGLRTLGAKQDVDARHLTRPG